MIGVSLRLSLGLNLIALNNLMESVNGVQPANIISGAISGMRSIATLKFDSVYILWGLNWFNNSVTYVRTNGFSSTIKKLISEKL